MDPRAALAAVVNGESADTELKPDVWLVTDPPTAERLLTCQAARALRTDGGTATTSWGPDGLATWLAARRAMRPALTGSRVTRFVPEISDYTRTTIETWRGAINLMRESVRLVSAINMSHLLGEPDPALATLLERELTLADRRLLRSRRLRHAQRATYATIATHLNTGLATMLADHGFDDHARTLTLRTMLLSGHHVPAAALAWTLHELAAHPQLQQRARDEGPRFCRAAVREALRLHPPVWQLRRRLDAPVARFPEGATLLFSPYLNQRDHRVYPAHDEFRPSRWLTGFRPTRGSYFPFAMGPRSCPAAQLALTELTAIVATVLDAFHLAPHRPPATTRGVLYFPRGALIRLRPV